MSIEVSGLDDMLNVFRDLGGSLTDEKLATAMTANMLDLKAGGVALAPRDEGDLEGTARHRVTKSDNAITGLVAFTAENNQYPYAVWAHEAVYQPGEATLAKPSWMGMRPGRKYLSRAWGRRLPAYIANLESALAEAIEEASNR